MTTVHIMSCNNFKIRHFIFIRVCPFNRNAYETNGIPYRYDGLSYRKTGITEALYHSGYTAYAPLRQRPPGYGVSSSRFHMARIRTHRTSCNMQVSACRTWRRRCNPSGELSDGYSYGILHYVSLLSNILMHSNR